MRKLATFLRAHCGALVLLVGELAALALFYLLRGSQTVMDWWLDTVSMPVKWAVSAVVDPLPFSACEAGATALIVLFLALLGRAVWQAAHKRFAPLGAWVLHFAATALGLYVLVCALWGTQYYGTGFAQKAGMTAGPVSTKDLADVTMYFGMKVNELAQQVPRDENGVFAVEDRTILQSAAPIYDGLTEEYPFLQSPTRTPKPAFYSKLMSAAGFTGYLCPVVGESTLNVDCPTMFLPVTVAHELAHQRGVAAEQEANYVGIRAATTCDDVIYQYSGWLFGYLHLSNAWYSADPQAASYHFRLLCREARADFATNDAYWAGWEGPVKEAGETVYTAFLENYGQDLGMKSYGACVDLLVEYYKDIAWAS